MLFSALVLAMPRDWMHNCFTEHAEHETDHSDAAQDVVDHGTCSVCIFSMSFAVASDVKLDLTGPSIAIDLSQDLPNSFAIVPLPAQELRGPPNC